MNLITLIGRLGMDPELKTLERGKVVNVNLAVTRRGYTKADGTKVENKTDWFPLTLWDKRAEIISEYAHKGDEIWVSGEMISEKYTDSSGSERTSWKVSVNTFGFLGSRQKRESETSAAPVTTSDPEPRKDMGSSNDLPF